LVAAEFQALHEHREAERQLQRETKSEQTQLTQKDKARKGQVDEQKKRVCPFVPILVSEKERRPGRMGKTGGKPGKNLKKGLHSGGNQGGVC